MLSFCLRVAIMRHDDCMAPRPAELQFIGLCLLTELDEVVDSDEDLHLCGEWLDGRRAVVLVHLGERLRALVATLEQWADDDIVDIAG